MEYAREDIFMSTEVTVSSLPYDDSNLHDTSINDHSRGNVFRLTIERYCLQYFYRNTSPEITVPFCYTVKTNLQLSFLTLLNFTIFLLIIMRFCRQSNIFKYRTFTLFKQVNKDNMKNMYPIGLKFYCNHVETYNVNWIGLKYSTLFEASGSFLATCHPSFTRDDIVPKFHFTLINCNFISLQYSWHPTLLSYLLCCDSSQITINLQFSKSLLFHFCSSNTGIYLFAEKLLNDNGEGGLRGVMVTINCVNYLRTWFSAIEPPSSHAIQSFHCPYLLPFSIPGSKCLPKRSFSLQCADSYLYEHC